MSPDALTAMEANLALRWARDAGHARVRPSHRLAELDLPTPQCGRRQGRAQGLRQGRKGCVRLEPGVMEASEAAVIRQHLIDPEICIRCNTCESTCPVGAITHDARNYVVDANICNLLYGLRSALPDRQHRQLAAGAAFAGLQRRSAVRMGGSAGGTERRGTGAWLFPGRRTCGGAVRANKRDKRGSRVRRRRLCRRDPAMVGRESLRQAPTAQKPRPDPSSPPSSAMFG